MDTNTIIIISTQIATMLATITIVVTLFINLSKKIDSLNDRITKLEIRMERLEMKFDSLDEKYLATNKRIDKIEIDVKENNTENKTLISKALDVLAIQKQPIG